MTIVSELIVGDTEIAKYDNGVISNITINGEDCHFAKRNTVNGTGSAVCDNAVNEPIYDMRMYGNSVQDGIPTPENPIEVESVGVPSINIYNKDAFPLTQGQYILYKTGASSSSGSYMATLDYIPIEPNTTYSINYTSGGNNPGIAFYNVDKTYISGVKSGVGFTTPDKARYLRFSVNTGTDPNTVQINAGATVLDFVPYGYNLPIKINDVTLYIDIKEPLRKIGEYADYIDFKQGKIIRNIGKKYLNGMALGKHDSYSNIYPLGIKDIKSGINPLSNIFDSTTYPPTTSIADIKKDFCIKAHASGSNVYMSDSIHTATKFNTFIGGNYILYVLATPTEETIELPTIPTSKGTTIIDTETNVKPSEISVEYWKQI